MKESGRQEADSRAAGLARTLLALVVLFAFWAAVGYTFWPQLLPGLLAGVQTVRGVGAKPVESKYFDVRNASDASESQVKFVVQTLEADYEAIHKLLGIPSTALRAGPPTDRIPVLFTNGPGVAVADEKGLNIFYDNGVMNVDTAPFFLALIVGGRSFSMDSSLFPQFGFAVYVTEEIGRAQSMIGQSSDAWVELFRQKDALLPLAQAWDLRMPENEEQMFDFMRGLIEGGSFTRWVAKTYGLKAAQDLRDGWKIESITGLSLAEAEKAWLAAVAAQQLQPKSCELALPSLFPRSFCRKLESG